MKSWIFFLRLIWHIRSLIPITVGLWLHMDHLWLVLSVSLACMLRHTHRRNNMFGYNHLSKLMCLCFYIGENNTIEVNMCGEEIDLWSYGSIPCINFQSIYLLFLRYPSFSSHMRHWHIELQTIQTFHNKQYHWTIKSSCLQWEKGNSSSTRDVSTRGKW